MNTTTAENPMAMPVDNRPIVLIATNNNGKAKGILLSLQGHWLLQYYRFLTYADLRTMGYDVPDPEETASTYYGNCHIKGKDGREFAKRHPELNIVLIISDDSGLSVKALPNVMGVYSARLCKDNPNATDEDRCNRLLELMEGKKDRGARYTAHVALYSTQRDLLAEGSGSTPVLITQELYHPTPGNGLECFGYDRVTCVNNRQSPHHETPIPYLSSQDRTGVLQHRITAMASIIRQMEQVAMQHVRVLRSG